MKNTKINTIDRKLLFQLDKDSRQSLTQIARCIRQSQQVVSYRLNNLQNNNVFRFFTAIDVAKLGFTVHRANYAVRGASEADIEHMIGFFTNHPLSMWVARFDGKFDFAVAILAQNPAQLQEVFQAFNKSFGTFVKERQLSTVIQGNWYSRDYLASKTPKKVPESSAFQSSGDLINIDSTDFHILKELVKNSRAKSSYIAKTCNISVETASQRIKRLKQDGVIQKFLVQLNNPALGQLHFKILVNLKSEASHEPLAAWCQAHPNVFFMNVVLGPWDAELDVEVESMSQLRSILANMRSQFATIVDSYSALSVYQVDKYDMFPFEQSIFKQS